jgi:hypothetical protein
MKRGAILLILGALAMSQACVCAAEDVGNSLSFKERFIGALAHKVPEILSAQDPKTGRFGTGIWMVNDQHPIFPLAVAWATKSKDNPYYHDPKVLEAIMAGGDALIEDQAPDGQWEFRKKDGSTWGMIYQPWTYSRWIRAFGLVRDGMPEDRRKRWEKALLLGFSGIARTQLTRPVNIPAHQAMGLYIAGQVFDKPEWCEKAKAFMAKVVAAQDECGFWTENYGPVVMYNFVYVDALGVYYSVSKDKTVLPALERAAKFHSAFIYHNGSLVETVDERNPYKHSIAGGNVGFSFTPEGRGYLLRQWTFVKAFDPDTMASFIEYGEEGSTVPTAAAERDHKFVSDDDKSLIRRKGDWFICVSAYHCPVLEKRWIQDRQNFISVYNDRVGLILGGGNTKLQPLWSNFTVGDTSLLHRTPGEANPKFTPPPGLIHIPSAAALQKAGPPGLMLDYGEERCEIVADPVDDKTVNIRIRATTKSGMPVAGHITLIPHMGKPFASERTPEQALGDEPFVLTSEQLGSWIEHAGWRLTIPQGATVNWPVLPHNPYTKDGFAKPNEGRIVVSVPFSEAKQEYTLTLTVK